MSSKTVVTRRFLSAGDTKASKPTEKLGFRVTGVDPSIIDRGDSSANTYSFISGGSPLAEDERRLMGVKRENEGRAREGAGTKKKRRQK